VLNTFLTKVFSNADVNDDYFSVEIHYKGFFCGLGKKRIYMDNKIDWFDFCNTDTWSLLYVDDFLGILECNNSASTRVYWCEPGKSVGDGLRSLRGDADIIAMSNVASTCKNIMLYVDHLNFLDGIFHNGTQQLQQVEHTSPEWKSSRLEVTRMGSQEGIETEEGEQDLGANEDSEGDSDFIIMSK